MKSPALKKCPCGLKNDYSACCGRFIQDNQLPDSPEALMRSRYTAYTQANVDYIARTMLDRALVHFDRKEARAWARSVKWLRLEVLKSDVEGTSGFVEFRAYYSYRNQMQVMHELSEFRLEAGQWYYIGEKNTH